MKGLTLADMATMAVTGTGDRPPDRPTEPPPDDPPGPDPMPGRWPGSPWPTNGVPR